MYQMVYASKETLRLSSANLVSMLEVIRENNARLGVTGMLLHQRGEFLQVLEGEAPTVRRLYERIARDPRHTGTVVLHQAFLPHREFADWSMGFRDLDALSAPEILGFSRLLQSGISAEHFASDPPRAKALLLAFKAGDLVLPATRAPERPARRRVGRGSSASSLPPAP